MNLLSVRTARLELHIRWYSLNRYRADAVAVANALEKQSPVGVAVGS